MFAKTHSSGKAHGCLATWYSSQSSFYVGAEVCVSAGIPLFLLFMHTMCRLMEEAV